MGKHRPLRLEPFRVRGRFSAMKRRILLLLLATAVPAALPAQQRAPEFVSWQAPLASGDRLGGPALMIRSEQNVATPWLVVGGVVGGGVGLGAGALIGGVLGGGDKICGDDPCGFQEAILGAIGGEVALLPLGVHLANGRRGKYLPALAASAAIAGLGIALSGNGDRGEVMIAVPVLQLVSSILIERGT